MAKKFQMTFKDEKANDLEAFIAWCKRHNSNPQRLIGGLMKTIASAGDYAGLALCGCFPNTIDEKTMRDLEEYFTDLVRGRRPQRVGQQETGVKPSRFGRVDEDGNDLN